MKFFKITLANECKFTLVTEMLTDPSHIPMPGFNNRIPPC